MNEKPRIRFRAVNVVTPERAREVVASWDDYDRVLAMLVDVGCAPELRDGDNGEQVVDVRLCAFVFARDGAFVRIERSPRDTCEKCGAAP